MRRLSRLGIPLRALVGGVLAGAVFSVLILALLAEPEPYVLASFPLPAYEEPAEESLSEAAAPAEGAPIVKVASLPPLPRADAAAPILLKMAPLGSDDDSLRAGSRRSAKPELPAWKRFAAATPEFNGRPRIAVVIDDLGLNRPGTWKSIKLPAPLTLAFITYADDLARMTQAARERGHELLVHIPMEPHDHGKNPGPNALLTSLPPDELERRLDWSLSRFEGYVGANNHMGSKFTSSARHIEPVMRELKGRGLLFLDSFTDGASIAAVTAERVGVPTAGRDVFLDHEVSRDFVRAALRRTEEIARRTGRAIAIGHPHAVTLEALARWLPTLHEKGFVLVPISAVVRERRDFAKFPMDPAG